MGLGYNAATRLKVNRRTTIAATLTQVYGVTAALTSPVGATNLTAQIGASFLVGAATLTPAPQWLSTPSVAFTESVAGSVALPVSNATSVSFAPGSTTASWLSITSSLGVFYLTANGTQVDANDLTGVKLRATNSLGGNVDSATFGVTVNLSRGESPASGAATWVAMYDLTQNYTALADLERADSPDAGNGSIGHRLYSTLRDGNAATIDGWGVTRANAVSGSPVWWTMLWPAAGDYERTVADVLTGENHFKVPG